MGPWERRGLAFPLRRRNEAGNRAKLIRKMPIGSAFIRMDSPPLRCPGPDADPAKGGRCRIMRNDRASEAFAGFGKQTERETSAANDPFEFLFDFSLLLVNTEDRTEGRLSP